MPEATALDWSSVQVAGELVRVSFDRPLPTGFALEFEALAEIRNTESRGEAWGRITLMGETVMVASVLPGSEADLKYALKKLVDQARHNLETQGQALAQKGERKAREAEEAQRKAAEMERRFREP